MPTRLSTIIDETEGQNGNGGAGNVTAKMDGTTA